MIDKTLAHMIDETLPECRNSYASRLAKMLEVHVDQAHLVSLLRCPFFEIRDFVRELFTINRVPACGEKCPCRSVRPDRAEHARAASRRSGQARGRRCRRRGCGPR